MNSISYYKEKYFNIIRKKNKFISQEIENCFNEKSLEEIYIKLLKLPHEETLEILLELICEDLLICGVAKIERSGMKLGLHRMESVLKYFGNPEKNLKVIHTAGTNGKGSVSSYLKTVLSKKYKVGMYSSPSMISINDRIRINDTFITHREMYSLYKEVEEKWYKNNPNTDDNLSFFEVLTVVAILYFRKNNVDFAIMEVGLGGRYDATNIFSKKILSIITKIGLDHTNILGDTLEKIAFEKAGIIKENDNVIIYPAIKSVENIFESVCNEKNAKLSVLDISEITIEELNYKHSIFSYKNYKNLKIKMLGVHQIKNSSLAILALKNLNERKEINISDKEIVSGIENTFWAGRLEWLNHNILIDGAHNIDGVTSLVNYIKQQKFSKIKVLLGILTDKDYKEMIAIFETLDAQFNITKVPIEIRSSSLEDLKNSFKKPVVVYNDYKEATNKLYSNLKEDEILLISGSLYLISAVRKILVERIEVNNE